MCRHYLLAGMLGCLLASFARGQNEQPPKPGPSLEEFSDRAAALKLSFADDPNRAAPQLSQSPVLRSNDPTREEADGAVWLWLDGQRPVASLCLIHKRGRWNYELVSLTDEALKLTGRPTWIWEPKASARTWISIDDPVPESARARGLALRRIARRFAASELRRGETFPLRLMDRPIYTYADAEHDIVEGALLAMAYGTNPEVLIQIEARKIEGKLKWQVAFARLSAAEVTVRLGENEVWSVGELLSESAYDPREPYYAVGERPARK